MELTPHQDTVITKIIADIIEAKDQDFVKDSIVELTGGAGVGKTFSILYIINYLKMSGWNIAITTPTHASLEVAKNIAEKFKKEGEKEDESIIASTIHSFLNLKIENDYKLGKQVLKKDKGRDPKKCDLLIIDEKSMVGEELFDYVEDEVNSGRVKAVLMVGDKYQLPVVNDKMMELDDSHRYELTEIVRQAADNPLIRLSLDLRKCIELQRFPKISLILNRHPDVPMVYNAQDFFKAYAADDTDINHRVIGAYTNELVNNYNRVVRGALLPNDPYLKSGDRVILQGPNVLKGPKYSEIIHSNGQNVELSLVMKTIKKMKGTDIHYYKCSDTEKKSLDVIAPESEQEFYQVLETIAGKAKNAKGEFRKELWMEYFSMKEEFTEIKYIYSATIHKLQGSSFMSVYGDVRDIQGMQGKDAKTDDMLFRLLYVLVTRSSDKLLLLRNE